MIYKNLLEILAHPVGFELADEDDIIGYEVVMEPDDDEQGHFTFSVRVPVDVNHIKVPKEYLKGLKKDTPLKVEVGAIEDRDGFFGNQTFTEVDGFCNNKKQEKCPDDDDDDEEE